MYYFALLQTPQRELTPEQGQAEMAAYGEFHARERAAIRAGDALAPEGVRVSGGADNPVVTDGPFAEGRRCTRPRRRRPCGCATARCC
jgi:hypothetical protein